MKNKTVFIYVNQGFSVRYLLRSSILSTLANNSDPIDIVILSHNGDEKIFIDSFESNNIKVEKLANEEYEEYLHLSRLQRVLIDLRAYVLNGNYNTRTIDDFREIYIFQKGWIKTEGLLRWIKGLLWETATWLLKKSFFLRKLLILFESRFFCPSFHSELFKKYSPDLVVVSALCGFKYNELFAREAKKQGIPVCCVVLSWDNTTGMGMPGYNPDYVIGWTENMKKELIELNDIDSKKIYVGGVAHFDPYYSDNFILSKEKLFKKLGLDLNKKTIFYATKSPKRFPWGPELVSDLANRIKDGSINYDAQILVRIHPLHYRTNNGKIIFQDILDEYQKVSMKNSSIILNTPETISKNMDFDLSDDETKIVASILKYSDIMINMFSTMVIEAAIFDLPSINICIKDKWVSNFNKSRQDIMIDYVQNHNQRVVQSIGVKTVFNFNDLCEGLNNYLDNPSLDRSGRELIVKNEAGPYQGNAGKKIGKYISSIL